MSKEALPVYTVGEFTEEVIRQLKGIIGADGRVEFEILVYNSSSFFDDDDERCKKGLCVVLEDHNYGDCAKLKYAVEWSSYPLDLFEKGKDS